MSNKKLREKQLTGLLRKAVNHQLRSWRRLSQIEALVSGLDHRQVLKFGQLFADSVDSAKDIKREDLASFLDECRVITTDKR